MNRYGLILLVTLVAAITTEGRGEPATDNVSNSPIAARGDDTDRLSLDTSFIRGNQELPKVLYIVPWKDSAVPDIDGRPAGRLVDEVLAPVDREVFLRQELYFEQLYSASADED